MQAMEPLHPDSQVIDRLGGPTAIALLCHIKPQAVSQWRRGGIPSARRQYLQLLRPDAFKREAAPVGMSSKPEVRNAA